MDEDKQAEDNPEVSMKIDNFSVKLNGEVVHGLSHEEMLRSIEKQFNFGPNPGGS